MKYLQTFFIALVLLFSFVRAADKTVCLQPKEVGPCRKADPNFFYNSEVGECQSFFYGGCHGNDNRFPTKEACEQTCL
ncbi:protease inhibitor-like [Teleopsis dalmanni]|uniref:protease inhibitor-like n=1 Tax=Teleopsis dalmanni TaxID=139649 RepID=UPI0018CC98F3|nr:protease inhibitor-like [Teleopsis dalmanni]